MIPLILSLIKNFLVSYWKPILIALLFFATYMYGVSTTNYKWEKKIAEERLEVIAEKEKLQSEFDTKQSKLLSDFEVWKNEHSKPKEIIKYVSEKADSNCTINNGFVRLHNDSIGLRSTESRSELDDLTSNITLSRVGDIVSQNYGICLTEMKKLETLQQVIKDFQEIQKKQEGK